MATDGFGREFNGLMSGLRGSKRTAPAPDAIGAGGSSLGDTDWQKRIRASVGDEVSRLYTNRSTGWTGGDSGNPLNPLLNKGSLGNSSVTGSDESDATREMDTGDDDEDENNHAHAISYIIARVDEDDTGVYHEPGTLIWSLKEGGAYNQIGMFDICKVNEYWRKGYLQDPFSVNQNPHLLKKKLSAQDPHLRAINKRNDKEKTLFAYEPHNTHFRLLGVAKDQQDHDGGASLAKSTKMAGKGHVDKGGKQTVYVSGPCETFNIFGAERVGDICWVMAKEIDVTNQPFYSANGKLLQSGHPDMIRPTALQLIPFSSSTNDFPCFNSNARLDYSDDTSTTTKFQLSSNVQRLLPGFSFSGTGSSSTAASTTIASDVSMIFGPDPEPLLYDYSYVSKSHKIDQIFQIVEFDEYTGKFKAPRSVQGDVDNLPSPIQIALQMNAHVKAVGKVHIPISHPVVLDSDLQLARVRRDVMQQLPKLTIAFGIGGR